MLCPVGNAKPYTMPDRRLGCVAMSHRMWLATLLHPAARKTVAECGWNQLPLGCHRRLTGDIICLLCLSAVSHIEASGRVAVAQWCNQPFNIRIQATPWPCCCPLSQLFTLSLQAKRILSNSLCFQAAQPGQNKLHKCCQQLQHPQV